MSRADSTHHQGPLAGLGAGAAAVLTGGWLILVAARRQLGEVATVVAWALMAAVIGAVIAATVYAVLWLRHRVLHPEVLSGGRAAAAGLAADPVPPQAITAPAAAAIDPPREIHLHIYAADPAEAAAIIRQALPGHAAVAIGDGT